MIKKLVKDSLIYSFATFLSRGIMFILLPLYTRVLTPTEYGINDLLIVYNSFIILFVSMEILQAIARFYPEETSPALKKEISSTGFWFLMRNCMIFIGLGFVFSGRIAYLIFGDGSYDGIVRAAIAAAALNLVFNYMQSQLRWDIKSLDYSIASILYVITSALTSVLFIVVLRAGGIGIFYGQMSGALLGCFVSYIRNRQAYGFVYSKDRMRSLLAFSMPFMISSFMVILSVNLDKIVIQRMLDIDTLGIYGIGVKISSVVSLLFLGFNLAVTPLIYANAKSPELAAELSRLFSFFVPAASLISAYAFLFSRELIGLLIGSAFTGASEVMPVLVLGSIFANLYLFTPGLSISKRTKPFIFISFLTVLMSFTMNIILVARIGIMGAAIATLVSSGFNFLLHYCFSQRAYSIPFDLKKAGWSLALTVATAIASYVINMACPDIPSGLILKLVFALIVIIMLFRINPSMKELIVAMIRYLRGGKGSVQAASYQAEDNDETI